MQQANPQYIQQTSQQPPIPDTVLLTEPQPINQQHISSNPSYHQSSMPSSVQSAWSNTSASPWSQQQDVKPAINMGNHMGSPPSALTPHQNTSRHSSYGPSPTNNFSSPASNYSGSTNSFNNRPSPYPIPTHPHHMKYSSNTGGHHQQGMQQGMQQQYQQVDQTSQSSLRAVL